MTILKNKIIIALLTIFVMFILFKSFWYVAGILDNLQLDLPRQYEQLPSDWLLKEMSSPNETRAHIAYVVLVDRKEPRVVPKIIKKINKGDINSPMYIMALAELKDERALHTLVNLYEKNKMKGVKSDIYRETVIALSNMKYQPLWPEVARLAKSRYAEEIGLAITALENFEKIEGIPLLEEIKKRIEENDYTRYVIKAGVIYYFPSSVADEAIANIKKVNKK